MMRYAVLNSIVLFVITFGVLVYTRVRPSRPLLLTLCIVLVMTAIFDSLIIMSGIVGYDAQRILGVVIWQAPIEDFAYAVASVILVGLLWEYYAKDD